MNIQVVKRCLDPGVGGPFLVSFITGFFKFMFLMRMFGLVDRVLPLALMMITMTGLVLHWVFLVLPTWV